ncbi:MarR family transcriptional regulator [Martelella sp. HB161492]|uniref:MarR family winged helix-turn-helix transcriptional regulator n=1 Tax=Martelella sp. HB161492 TaxID=2720726 RepID=UPI00159248D1|nr:MarR family transcriptional regulator [Martelella sp. HB161492]
MTETPLTEDTQRASESARSVMKSLRRIAHAMDTRSKRISRETGLTIPQIAVLEAVRDQGALTTMAISRHADLSPATTVTILDKLEAKGLIERHRSREDRRIVRAVLTAAGRETLTTAPNLFGAQFATDFTRFSSEERAEIAAAFRKVADLFDQPNITPPQTADLPAGG